MQKVFFSSLLVSLGCVLPCQAATMMPVCSDLTLQVIDRGEEELIANECGSHARCQERYDGKVAYKEYFVRLKVVLRAAEVGCPEPGTVYRVPAVITEDRIRASLASSQDKKTDDSSVIWELRNIRSLQGSRLPGLSSLVVDVK
ncbi:MAG: hypothetical protein HQL21_06400 [Candidatus Omnitrophica bacterium]|nr:hypothetical protein [Candidatus Omnitrophota bacterium]